MCHLLRFFIQFGMNFEACIGYRRADQLDDCTVAAQEFSAPIDCDK